MIICFSSVTVIPSYMVNFKICLECGRASLTLLCPSSWAKKLSMNVNELMLLYQPVYNAATMCLL